MSAFEHWPWVALLALGAAHGINPGMGWLFAVALGLQEGSGRAVRRALAPLAVGHGLAIGGVVSLAAMVGLVVPTDLLKWVVAAALLGLGLYKLIRDRHPTWGGMRVGAKELTIWSWLMASAHGAGLMVLPFVMETGMSAGHGAMAGSGHAAHTTTLAAGVPDDAVIGLLATALHTVGYLVVTGLVAVLVYKKLGLGRLRTLWLNLDLLWAIALILTALVTPFI